MKLLKKRNSLHVLLTVCLMIVSMTVPAFAGTGGTSGKTAAAGCLTETETGLYQVLKDGILKVADPDEAETSTSFKLSGTSFQSLNLKTAFTCTDLNLSTIYGSSGSVSSQAIDDAVDAFLSENRIELITEALISDSPYEMFWYGHKTDFAFGLSAYDETIEITSLQIDFLVAENYQDGSSYTVNSDLIQKAADAAANAAEIVAACKDMTTLEKLTAYRDAICRLASYNTEAASSGDVKVNCDPWQMIYVFDEDPSTAVVCEGYSRAFQYLCDISEFDDYKDVVCCCVSGTMSDGSTSGAHMWNIVTMPDGKNYLVDITNSDEGAIGAGGELFLKGTAGLTDGWYTFQTAYQSRAYYYYSDSTQQLWGSGTDSILLLASSDYDPAGDLVPVPLAGDVNLDGEVTASDLTMLARHVAKIEPITNSYSLANAEVTGDTELTAEDLTRLARYVAKIITEL